MNWELGAESLIMRRIDIADFWGWYKVVPVVAYWVYLIHIQLGFLGLRDIRRKESINSRGSPHVSMLLLLLKSRQWDVCTGRRCPDEESVVWQLTQFLLPGKGGSRLNMIGHPDWVKFCVELNCAPNQNIPSATPLSQLAVFRVYLNSWFST